MQNMPVHDHIHICLLCIFDTVCHKCLQLFLFSVCTIPTVLIRIHGDPEQVRTPVFAKLRHRILIYKVGKPCNTVCADPPKLHRLSFFIYKLCAFHRQCPILRRPRQNIIAVFHAFLLCRCILFIYFRRYICTALCICIMLCTSVFCLLICLSILQIICAVCCLFTHSFILLHLYCFLLYRLLRFLLSTRSKPQATYTYACCHYSFLKSLI